MPERATATPDRVLYDGACGLCHASVRFVVARDRAGRFRFAPQDAATADPSTVVVLSADGRRLVRSAAVLYMLSRLGGGWPLVAALGRLVPRPLGDAAYRAIARVRHRLFRQPQGLCPVVPPHLRDRFEV